MISSPADHDDPRTRWICVYEDKDGNEVVFPYKDMIYRTHHEANVSVVMFLFNAVLWGVHFKRCHSFIPDVTDLPNVEAELVRMNGQRQKVAVIGGPLFDATKAAREDKNLYEAEVTRATDALD